MGASEGEEAVGEDANAAERRAPTAREAMAALANVEYVKCAACVFAYRLAPTALDAFAVYTYSAFADVVPAWGYSLITFFGSAARGAGGVRVGAHRGDATRKCVIVLPRRERRERRTDVIVLDVLGGGGAALSRRAAVILRPDVGRLVVCGVIDAALGLCRLFVVVSPPSSRDAVIATLSITDVFTVFGLRARYMPVVLLGAMARSKPRGVRFRRSHPRQRRRRPRLRPHLLLSPSRHARRRSHDRILGRRRLPTRSVVARARRVLVVVAACRPSSPRAPLHPSSPVSPSPPTTTTTTTTTTSPTTPRSSSPPDRLCNSLT